MKSKRKHNNSHRRRRIVKKHEPHSKSHDSQHHRRAKRRSSHNKSHDSYHNKHNKRHNNERLPAPHIPPHRSRPIKHSSPYIPRHLVPKPPIQQNRIKKSLLYNKLEQRPVKAITTQHKKPYKYYDDEREYDSPIFDNHDVSIDKSIKNNNNIF
jgi:hypothetical protein